MAQNATKTASARERVLETACDLFYREGIRAVGVDTIIAESGVAKMSLYRNFASKDELVVAYLQRRDAEFWERWDAIMQRRPGDPRAQLRDYFTSLGERTSQPGYRGCPFVNTASEFPGDDHPARSVVAAHKRTLLARLRELAVRIGVDQPDAVAAQLALLIEGAYAASQSYGPAGPMAAVAAAADAIVTAHRPAQRGDATADVEDERRIRM
jgi:AcrR family transcriptional regulator